MHTTPILQYLHKHGQRLDQPVQIARRRVSTDSAMSQPQPRNPLHGVTLEQMLIELVDSLGWEDMGRAVAIRCFTLDPSVASSLRFLRRAPWARAKVEDLYLRHKGS